VWYNVYVRVRDVIRNNFKPQGEISFAEWQGISDRFAYAKKFMSETNPIFVTMKAQLKKLEDDILENKLEEKHRFEFNLNAGVIKEMFITPKKVQEDEAVGQIKYLRDFFREMEFWVFVKEDYEKQEADGKLIIHRDERH
jgi:hypothetical protein